MKQIKKKSYLFLAALLLLLQIGISFPVYAASGKLSIALSAKDVTVGNTVTVTLRASGTDNKSATADMVFTYNPEIFSFVSCNAGDYTGGEGGKVSFNGSNVDVKLKAIAQGSTTIKVEGSNGKKNGEALDTMTAAGVKMQVSGGAANNQSGDSSLSGLTLSAGELTPAFDSTVKEYSVTVPYEISSLEVAPQTTDSKAQVESVTGNTELQTGENTIAVTVKAENGATTVYQITVIREAEAVGTDTEPEEDSWQFSRLQEEYTKLDKKYQEEKSFSRKVIAVLIFIIIVLVIVCINLVLFVKRGNEDADDYVFGDSDKDRKRTGRVKSDSKKVRANDDISRDKKRDTADDDIKDADVDEIYDIDDIEDDDISNDGWLDNEDDLEIIDLNKI